MQMCPFCGKVYDESEYSHCPYCTGELDDDMSGTKVKDCPECGCIMYWMIGIIVGLAQTASVQYIPAKTTMTASWNKSLNPISFLFVRQLYAGAFFLLKYLFLSVVIYPIL